MGWLRNLWLGIVFVVREFRADRGADRSAALAYGTLLALVPLLATAAALFRAFFPFGPDQLVEMTTVILPYQPGSEQYAGLVRHLTGFVNRATALGYISSLIFLVIAYQLFQTVERTFNEIWNVATRRSVAKKVFSFTMLVFWGPVVIGLGSSALLWMRLQPWAPSQGAVLSLIQLAVPLLGLTMVYWLAPHTEVSIGAAATGGVLATLGLELLRMVFVWYLHVFPNINLIYGSATLAVLFLVTLFAFWQLVMIGAEVSYVVQNFHALKLERQGQPRLDVDPAVTAVAILTECYRRTAAGEPPATLVEIEQALGVRHGTTQRATDRLVEGGLLAITGPKRNAFVPAREAKQLSVGAGLEVGGAPRGALPTAPLSALARLGEVLRSAESSRREVLEGVTFADLVAQPSPDQEPGSEG
jgi:membrane protein